MQMRAFSNGLLFVATASALAQGGFGGGGFGGGGLGGGAGGTLGSADDGSDVVSHDHILTPGDRGEWPIKAKAGEIVIAEVSTTIFDAALEIVDDKETMLAENDDRRPGVQNPQLLFRFPKAGEYKILVKGYKSVAGGAYRISLRRFVPIELDATGELNSVVKPDQPTWFRLPLQKGQLALFSAVSEGQSPGVTFLDPSGEAVTLKGEHRVSSYYSNRNIFEPERDGDYFARVIAPSRSDTSFTARLRMANVRAASIDGAPVRSTISTDSFDSMEFEGKKGQLVEISAGAGSEHVDMILTSAETLKKDEENPSVPERGWYAVENSGKLPHRFHAFLAVDGKYRVSVVGDSKARNRPYEFQVRRPEKNFSGSMQASELRMGDVEFWRIEGQQGQLLDVSGTSSDFDMSFQLYSDSGPEAAPCDDAGDGFDPAGRFLLEKTGTYFIQVFANGNGGRGKYSLSARLRLPDKLEIGKETTGRIESDAPTAFTFEGKEGQTVALFLITEEEAVSANVIGPNLKRLTGASVGPAKDRVLTYRLAETGRHTIWLSGGWRPSGFRIKLLDLSG